MTKSPTALVTGASAGIGAVYADRLARRGHDLVLVARDAARLAEAAARLGAAYGVQVDMLVADLGQADGVAAVEARLRDDAAIGLIVNNAGLGPHGPALGATAAENDAMLRLNVTALHCLTLAASAAFVARGGGAIINIASVVALWPEQFNATYVASKAFVLALTQSLQAEIGPRGVRLQAVLPGLTRTEIFERAGVDIAVLDPKMVMEAGDLVDAALAGFDQGELVTIPSLPNAADWQACEAARVRLIPNLSHDRPAARYLTASAAA